jgi:hypothetical protein
VECGRERERPRCGRPVSAVASTAVDRPPVSHQIPLDLIDSSSIIGRFRGSSSDTGQGVFTLLPLRSQNSQRTVHPTIPKRRRRTVEHSEGIGVLIIHSVGVFYSSPRARPSTTYQVRDTRLPSGHSRPPRARVSLMWCPSRSDR